MKVTVVSEVSEVGGSAPPGPLTRPHPYRPRLSSKSAGKRSPLEPLERAQALVWGAIMRLWATILGTAMIMVMVMAMTQLLVLLQVPLHVLLQVLLLV